MKKGPIIKLFRRNWAILLLIIIGLIYLSKKTFQSYSLYSNYNSPKVGDVYIFSFDEKLSPYYLDNIELDSFYFFEHEYDFINGITSIKELHRDSFNLDFYFIYSKNELNKLLNNKKLSEIIR